MSKDEYVETIYIKDKKIDVGIDDYGQCYFFEFINDLGELQQIGCGSYNSYYLEEIYGYFDPKGTQISLYGKDTWDECTEMIKDRMKLHPDDEDYYMEIIRNRETTDFEIYDFEQMYKDRQLDRPND